MARMGEHEKLILLLQLIYHSETKQPTRARVFSGQPEKLPLTIFHREAKIRKNRFCAAL